MFSVLLLTQNIWSKPSVSEFNLFPHVITDLYIWKDAVHLWGLTSYPSISSQKFFKFFSATSIYFLFALIVPSIHDSVGEEILPNIPLYTFID